MNCVMLASDMQGKPLGSLLRLLLEMRLPRYPLLFLVIVMGAYSCKRRSGAVTVVLLGPRPYANSTPRQECG